MVMNGIGKFLEKNLSFGNLFISEESNRKYKIQGSELGLIAFKS
jgi:hypothetical protein